MDEWEGCVTIARPAPQWIVESWLRGRNELPHNERAIPRPTDQAAAQPNAAEETQG